MLIITLVLLVSVSWSVEYCRWDKETQTCGPNNEQFLLLLQQSTNEYSKFMRCERVKNQQQCNQYEDTCVWVQEGNGFCDVKLPALISHLSECVDDFCRQDLLQIDNLTNIDNFNLTCDSDSFLADYSENSFCRIVQHSVECQTQGRGICEYDICLAPENCPEFPERFPRVSRVDSAIVKLMNLDYYIESFFIFGRKRYDRIKILHGGMLDLYLDFDRNTMSRFDHCEWLLDCKDYSDSDLDHVKQQRQQRYQMKGGWGFVVAGAGAGMLCCLFICCSLREYRNIRRSIQQRQNDIELQTATNSLSAQQIMQRLEVTQYSCPSSEETSSTFEADGEKLSQEGKGNQEEDTYDPVCAVCYDEYSVGQNVIKLSCNHMYHEACLEQWVKTKGQRSTCPLCGSLLVDNE